MSVATAAWSRQRQAEAVHGSRRRRLFGLLAALGLEALVVLTLLYLGTRTTVPMQERAPLTTFDLSAPEAEPVREPAETPEPARQQERQPVEAEPEKVPPTPVTPSPAPPAESAVKLPEPLVRLPSDQLATADLRNLPAPKPRAPAGPPAPRGERDSDVVGRAPNGQPLYAAAWYREPYDSELRGYLSTADPGWALIACKTVADFKVDDCVGLDEWPDGSRLARAVLAAAWQFKVRPPRVGGQYKVGEWVRIRIDYGVKR